MNPGLWDSPACRQLTRVNKLVSGAIRIAKMRTHFFPPRVKRLRQITNCCLPPLTAALPQAAVADLRSSSTSSLRGFFHLSTAETSPIDLAGIDWTIGL
jgi:hypothetical protein